MLKISGHQTVRDIAGDAGVIRLAGEAKHDDIKGVGALNCASLP